MRHHQPDIQRTDPRSIYRGSSPKSLIPNKYAGFPRSAEFGLFPLSREGAVILGIVGAMSAALLVLAFGCLSDRMSAFLLGAIAAVAR